MCGSARRICDQFVCDIILDRMDLTEQILKGFALSKAEPEGVHRDVVWQSLCFAFASSVLHPHRPDASRVFFISGAVQELPTVFEMVCHRI